MFPVPLSLRLAQLPAAFHLALLLLQHGAGILVVLPVLLQAALGAVEDGLALGALVGLHGVAEAAVTEPGVGEELQDLVSLRAVPGQLGHDGEVFALRVVSAGDQQAGELLVNHRPVGVPDGDLYSAAGINFTFERGVRELDLELG